MSLTISKPTIGGDSGNWGGILNGALDAIVTAINAINVTSLLALSGGTMTGRLNAKTSTSAAVALPAGAAKTIDLSTGQAFSAVITGATSWTITNGPAAGQFMGFALRLVNGGSAAQTWPASVKWPSGSAPALSAAGTDMLVFLSDDAGATWRGTLAMKDSR